MEDVVQIILVARVPRRNTRGGNGNGRDGKILRDVGNDQVDSQMVLLFAPVRNFVFAACSKLEETRKES